MPRKAPGARARGLGAELRALRERTDLTVTEAARRLGWSTSQLSRLETGKRNIASEEVAALLALFGVNGPERDTLISRARSVDEPGWWEVELPGVPSNSLTLASYEAEASRMVCWEPMLIPGLLQIMDYTRAYMQADGLDPKIIETRLMTRLRRQQVLTSGVKYQAYIGEQALRFVVGGPQIMSAQLRWVLQLSERDNVSVRIVPDGTGPHPGMLGGFLLMDVPGRPIVLVEMLRSAVFLDEDPQTGPYVQAVDRIAAVALGATESVSLVADVIRELEDG